MLVIDLFGLTAEQVRDRFPAVYQWVLERVKPERDSNNRSTYRDNWWLFGEPRRELRRALKALPRYIATVETAKHRVFQFLDASILPDNKLVAIALSDPSALGVLSSTVHGAWALSAGSRLGVGNDPVYVKTTCFETFPFPIGDTGLTPELTARIRALAEQLDAHRKTQQAAHPGLTLTGMYNVLEKLRRGEALSAKDKVIHEQGLVSVLRSLHDELDAAVLEAYGWSDLKLPQDVDALLLRLTELNAKRAAEEAVGTVRWLRPEFQKPSALPQVQAHLPAVSNGLEGDADESIAPPASPPLKPRPWPAGLPEQIKAVAQVLDGATQPIHLDLLASHFKASGSWRKRLPVILDTLETLGRIQKLEGERWVGAGSGS